MGRPSAARVARVGGKKPARPAQVLDPRVPGLGRTGFSDREGYNGSAKGRRRPSALGNGPDGRRPRAGDRDTLPVTMIVEIRVGERGVMGAPRSRHRRGPATVGPHSGPAWWTPRSSSRRPRGGTAAPPMLHIIAHRGRPSRRAPRGFRRAGGRPARAAIRRVQGDHRSRARGKGRSRADRRRPVRLEHPATSLGRARRRPAPPPGRGRHPDRIVPGPTMSTTARRSIARTICLDGGRRCPGSASSQCSTRTTARSPQTSPPSSTAGLRDEAGAVQPPRDQGRRDRRVSVRDLAHRAGPRLASSRQTDGTRSS